MSLGELYDDLEAHILAAEPDDPRDERFVIDDLAKADWAVRKIARERRRLAEAREVAQAEMERIGEWISDQQARCEEATSFFEELLARYHRTVLADDPKAKTIRLPSGSLEARKAPDSLLIDESAEHADVTFAWVEEHIPTALVVRKSLDKNVLKRSLVASEKPEAGGFLAMDPVTGEVAPGVLFRRGETAFNVKTGDEA